MKIYPLIKKISNLSLSEDHDFVTILQELHQYLSVCFVGDNACENYNEETKEFFSCYKQLLDILLDSVKANYCFDKQNKILFDDFFLKGNPHTSFLVLVKSLTETSSVFTLENYAHLLSENMIRTLCKICRNMQHNEDVNLEFLSRLLGRLCVAGYSDSILGQIIPQMLKFSSQDFIWRRVCCRLVVGVPGQCLEAVVTPVLLQLPWYGYVEWLLGENVISNEKLKFLLTTKLLLIRQFQQDSILNNILGYLAQVPSRQMIFLQTLLKLLDAWGAGSALRHRSYSQQFYLTRALMICTAHLGGLDFSLYKQELLTKLLHGVEIHIGSPDNSVRTLGMVVGENISKVLDPEGPKLVFEYEVTNDSKHLKSLLKLEENSLDITSWCDQRNVCVTKNVSSITRELKSCEITEEKVNSSDSQKDISEVLDSDDDLEPYDMSHDVVSKKQPLYIRDCLQGLINHDKPEWTEACLRTAQALIQTELEGESEVALELAKVLLHLENSYTIDDFVILRHQSLVAVLTKHPKEVALYLTDQFYDRNYNIRQRLDILEVLASASQELSKVHVQVTASDHQSFHSDVKHNTVWWKELVEKRIENKTRIISKGKKVEPQGKENKFADVAGYFFFPLLHFYDRKENTFDLLGEDCYVLGRLVYTLGVIMHSASNTTVAKQMGSALLEFIWVLRYHTEKFVREALLFALCMAVISVPSFILLDNNRTEIMELQCWLQDIVEQDPNLECRRRAGHVLALFANMVKEVSKEIPVSTC
ncbi:telomere length regulation protein TEL2 homolog isoform X3 [Limulus polyphemus]|uniref:Telomere length regulation protein TEL2 homolog isoform X3 n=1 Tax=Limulus polyphemus TaxID=6850 RepID=A0ABM1ST20_LIMPO|nr:telomere length regulation protein TEL2 homolog isoform X3 [Limulus polyphemus]